MNTDKRGPLINCGTNIVLLINQLALCTDVAGSAHQFNFSRRFDASQLVDIRPVEIRQLRTPLGQKESINQIKITVKLEGSLISRTSLCKNACFGSGQDPNPIGSVNPD
jgi:hypothetical protein